MNHARMQFACQYYRLAVPLEGFEKAGLANTWCDTLDEGADAAILGMTSSDFSLFWGTKGQSVLDQFKILQEMKASVDDDGEIHLPPVLILDTDDNRDYVHPHNTVFVTDGVRAYPDTTLLSPGQTVWSPDGEGGKHVLWEDKKTYYGGNTFDIERNLHEMNITHRIQRLVDGMTTPSPQLAKYLKEVVGVKNVYVFPNTIIPEHYRSFPLIPHVGIRILWQGGSSHSIDWWPLRDAIKTICLRNPSVIFVVFGNQEDWIKDYIPASQLEQVGWVQYPAYRLQRALLQIDINLAPLADNLFNRCKSAIKWYEASVWDKPEVTLASRVPPFSDEMTDNVNGLLYTTPEEFIEKLQLLIDSSDLRNRLALEAKEWVKKNRTPEVTIPPLWEFYEELQRQKRRKLVPLCQ